MMKRVFIMVAVVHIALAVKPANYIEKPKVPDKYPPKYEYNYFIANRNNHAAQGHKEIRNGDNTAGNYFVNLPKGESKTLVNYIANEWGFFPIQRYISHGPHHRVSGHFALGQHAIERLNETSLNTNEILIAAAQKQQELPAVDKQINTKLYPLQQQANADQIQLIPTSHQIRQPQIPLVYQQHQPQQIPLIYEYAPQHQPHMNYFYQHSRPQDVIYHQQPIVSMAQLQEHPTILPTIVPVEQQPVQVQEQIEILPQLPQQEIKSNGNLLQVQDDLKESNNNAATLNQEIAKIKDDQAKIEEAQFEAPIVVKDENILPNNEETVIVQQKSKPIESYQPQKPQINVQILDQIDASTPKINHYQIIEERDQDLLGSNPPEQKEAPSRAFLRNFKKFHEQSMTTTVRPIQSTTPCCNTCCKNGNEGKTVAITQRPISSNFLAPVHAGVLLTKEKLDDCIDGHKSKEQKTIVEVKKNINVVVTKRPPVYGDRIFIESTPASVKPVTVTYKQQPVTITYQQQQTITSSPPRPIFIEKSTPAPTVFTQPIVVEKVVEKQVDRPVFIKSPPEVIEKVVHKPIVKTVEKPIFIEKVVKEPYEVQKIVDRPVFIKTPPEIVKEPVIVEKAVIKEVKVPVEKTVFVQSLPETKIVQQPVIQTVEKPVYIEKIVKEPYEVQKIVKIERPVEKIVEKPVIHEVEKIVDRPVIQEIEKPVYIEKIVDRPIEKFIDRPIPVPVPYAVPFEKHIFHKPDFHVVAKAVPTKHKLFDFDALLRFLTKKEEVKHIYVPATPQHQLSQLNKHQLINTATTYSTIEPIKESASFLDYSRYATSHLNPIKPVYGVPSTTTLLKPITYSSPDPYAPSYNTHQAVASVPQSWVNGDSITAQSQTSYIHKDNYVGPTPYWEDYWANNAVSTKDGIKFRRHVENGRSLRIEYGGFLPKMNPSVEIDENGKPIKKEGET